LHHGETLKAEKGGGRERKTEHAAWVLLSIGDHAPLRYQQSKKTRDGRKSYREAREEVGGFRHGSRFQKEKRPRIKGETQSAGRGSFNLCIESKGQRPGILMRIGRNAAMFSNNRKTTRESDIGERATVGGGGTRQIQQRRK